MLASLGNAAAVAYANYGAGRSPPLTQLARRAIGHSCSSAYPRKGRPHCRRIAPLGDEGHLGDPRPYPNRDLRSRFRGAARTVCGEMNVGMLASGDVSNARFPVELGVRGPLDQWMAVAGPAYGNGWVGFRPAALRDCLGMVRIRMLLRAGPTLDSMVVRTPSLRYGPPCSPRCFPFCAPSDRSTGRDPESRCDGVDGGRVRRYSEGGTQMHGSVESRCRVWWY